MSAHALSPDVPSHVPAHLVRGYCFSEQEGVDRDPFLANRKIFSLPEIYFSPREGNATRRGSWVVARAELIREVYLSPETFSNKGATGFLQLIGQSGDLLPVEVDPPQHAAYRAVLAPWFTPARLSSMEGEIHSAAERLIAQLLPRGGCEFEADFGRRYPASIFLQMMGMPQSRLDEFVAWELQTLHGETIEDVRAGALSIAAYLEELVAERGAAPGDDLVSAVISAQIDGRPITHDEIIGMCFLLFLGGLDTVTATINFAFKHLAERPDQQALLRAEPALIPNAVEEFLRAYTVTPSPRVVAKDVEFHGVKMRAGDRVVLAVPMSGRDPQAWKRPNEIDFRRPDPRSLTFAAGPHFCLGAALARREIRIALESWLKLAPPFRLNPSEHAITTAGGVWSVKRLPLLWA